MYNEKAFHSGYVAIAGRPNVGKSTLLNTLLGEKISIVTNKAQTTRNRILGIKNLPDAQIIFIDTPGIHKPIHKLGETMVRSAIEALDEVDIILFMSEPVEPKKGDRMIINLLGKINKPVFLIINKIDTVKKNELLPVINTFSELYRFAEIIPVSALKKDGTDLIIEKIVKYIPEGPKFYPDDVITDQVERFIASEIVREKLIELTEEEVPHSIAVEITKWEEREDGLISIRCNIYVERESQKAIIIGKGGTKLKEAGSRARQDMERLFNTKVFLELWVKVKKHWRNDIKILKELGYK
ncbi:MAG: GTPase Era [Nitrospirae bacterium]|jgi:GTP-binding protein Era|nr:GTPase Era [Nitrospirota bacterium]